MGELITPGVYIAEEGAFPNSIAAVSTSVPIFIGYTQTAERQGKSLVGIPARISSLAEYIEYFGGSLNPLFTIIKTSGSLGRVKTNDVSYNVNQKKDNVAYLFNSLRLFYMNGGSNCYVLSIGTYGTNTSLNISVDDFINSDSSKNVFNILEKEIEPTLIVIPDIIAKGKEAYPIYQKVLEHCNKTQKRFGIFDLLNPLENQTIEEVLSEFQTGLETIF